MAKANITEYDSTAGNNTVINDIDISEGCSPSTINNAIRELMAHLKNVDTGSQALTALSVTGNVSVGGTFTSRGIDDNADATAITISSSEQVGIGTTSPTSDLHVSGGAGAHVAIQSSAGSHWRLGDAVGSSNGIFVVRDHTNSANRIQILADGKTQIAQGITFGSDTAAANTLDDYEEGTWTPTIRGESGTEPTQGTHTATYVKIGQLVHIEARMVITTDNGGSGLEVVGLPFVTANAVVFHMAETAVYGVVGGMFSNGSVAAGSGKVFFREGNGTSAWQTGTYVQRSGGQYTMVGTYRTTS